MALLGSIDFSLEDLEKNVLNAAVTPQIFGAMGGGDSVLSEEAAVCIKNLMTNEHLGNKCTRRLYALCIFPLLNQILQSILNSSDPISCTFLEAIAVQIWCIASTVPSALPQITASPLADLVTKRLAAPLAASTISADNALLQALLVAIEDNEILAQKLLQLNPQFLAISLNSTSAGKFDSFHLNSLLRLMCFLQVVRCAPAADSVLDLSNTPNFLLSTLQSPLPAAARFETDAAAVKLYFEILELAAESLELLITETGNGRGVKLLKSRSLETFYDLPFKLVEYFSTNFQQNFTEEGNADRIRLVRRIFSLVGTLLTIQEQLIMSGIMKIGRGVAFIQCMERVLQLSAAAPSEDFSVSDEVSGWLRAWLITWGDSDYPSIPETFFTSLIQFFFTSSSPVILTNTCALTSLLISYAPEAIQMDFCLFLNNLLCTDPFDPDHLEVLLAAVDGVTGIFDPQSKEWPAKSLSELKKDLQTAKERLQAASNFCDTENSMKESVAERVRSLDRLIRIL